MVLYKTEKHDKKLLVMTRISSSTKAIKIINVDPDLFSDDKYFLKAGKGEDNGNNDINFGD